MEQHADQHLPKGSGEAVQIWISTAATQYAYSVTEKQQHVGLGIKANIYFFYRKAGHITTYMTEFYTFI